MQYQRQSAALLLALVSLLMGCGGETIPAGKETFPVTGEVTVDGQAAVGVKVVLHDLAAPKPQDAAYSLGYTDESGKFSVSTYQTNDGAPEGDYAVTFSWVEGGVLTSKEGKDKLGGKYVLAAKSSHKIKVVKGQPVDMGKIDLKTK